MLPRILKNFNLFIDGSGYAGLVNEATLPDLALKMDEYRAGGMDAGYEIDMGMEAMTMKISLGEYDEYLLKAFGSGVRVQLRGAMVRDQDNTVTPVVCEVGGRVKKFTPNAIKAGDQTKPDHEITVDYFRWNQGGGDLFEIDVLNMVRNIGGVDQLAAIRDAIGL